MKEEEIKHAADELAKVKSLLERGTAKQNQLKAELKSVQVSSEERKNCRNANQLAFHIQQLNNDAALEKERLGQQETLIKELQQEQQAVDQKVKAETERIEALFAAVERAYALVCETDRSLSETIRVASQKKKRLRQNGNRQTVISWQSNWQSVPKTESLVRSADLYIMKCPPASA